ncbi:MAG TPA: hypothetical protein VGO00_26485, partial [Kofleriaceae bacterium]|nr:hypothetical protein [Kofleriaceae bacterium]
GGTLPIVSYESEYFTFDVVSNRFVVWAVDMTEAWAGDATQIAFTVPDLSKLAGFDAKMALEEHQAISGSTARIEATTQDMVAGRQSTTASSDWVIGSYCGDGVVDASEQCDDGGESATCNSDCTVAACGDSVVNFTAGEDCDPPDGTTCDASCHMIVAAPVAARHSMIWPAASRKIKNALKRFVPSEWNASPL